MAKKRARRRAEPKPEPERFRSRILGLESMRASEIDRHPKNWRQHSEGQRAVLTEILGSIGIAGALVVYRSETTGRWTLAEVDGGAAGRQL